MIISRLPEVKREYERRTGERLIYAQMTERTGVAASTISRLMDPTKPVVRIDGSTLSALCKLFGCQPGDILEYVTDANEEVRQSDE